MEVTIEKERLEHFMHHYSNCLNALDEVKDYIVRQEETRALNKLKDVKSELTEISHYIQELHDSLEAEVS